MGFDAAQTQSFNAGFILILAPLFAASGGGSAAAGAIPTR
jgi:dipeptide/tripeptide permease